MKELQNKKQKNKVRWFSVENRKARNVLVREMVSAMRMTHCLTSAIPVGNHDRGNGGIAKKMALVSGAEMSGVNLLPNHLL